MAEYHFSEEKNFKLIREREISFYEILPELSIGNYEVINNPNQEKYVGGRAYLLRINGYPHIVPFEEKDGKIFLKTIFKMRKMKKILEEKDGI